MTTQQFLNNLCLWHRDLAIASYDASNDAPMCIACSQSRELRHCDSCNHNFYPQANCPNCGEVIADRMAVFNSNFFREK